MKLGNIKDSYILGKLKKFTLWGTIKAILYFAIILFSLLVIASTFKIGGWSMYVVKSGSMEPAIHTGSVVFDKAEKDDSYISGDIITFKVPNSKDTVTHRIVEIKGDEGVTSYQVKGDANDAPDPDMVQKSQVVGRVIFSISYLGYLVAFARTLPGLVIFIILPALVIIYEEIGKIKEEVVKIKKAKKKTVKKIKEVEEEIFEDIKKMGRKK